MTQFLQQNQTMKQTHILTHKNQQALKILKMDSRELLELISECVQQNPFLDFHPSAQGRLSFAKCDTTTVLTGGSVYAAAHAA